MYVGSKGWYVNELKKLGVRYYEGKKIERYKAPILANILKEKIK